MTDLQTLTRTIRRNRFLPIPAEEQNFVGDGQFLAIGTEFLEHFITLGGLKASDRVLDIGSGIGRMALPLTQYLDEEQGGTYDGVDIVKAGVEWCQQHITTAYPSFTFQQLDIANSLYNPAGTRTLKDTPLPFADATKDFIFLTSVFTHLPLEDMAFYLKEIKRLLASGGRAFITLFLVNAETREAMEASITRPVFEGPFEWPLFIANPEHPMAAVGIAEDYFMGMLHYFGFKLERPVIYGNWRGTLDVATFQDICVITAS